MSRVPDGWRKYTIGDVVSEIDAGTSVNSQDKACSDGEKGVLKTSCVSLGYFCPDEHKVVVEDEVARLRVPVQGDRIILSRMNTPELVGANGYVPSDIPNVFLPDRLWQINSDRSVCSTKWLAQYLASPVGRGALSACATGTSGSMKNISKAKFKEIRLLLPPLPEQTKIAAILSSVDEAIAATQSVIDQTRKVKQGLLQDLLTRGIGHTRFKQTEIGEIPEAWEVKRLEDVVSKSRSITYGIVQTGEYIAGGVPCVRVVDMVKRQVQLSEMITTTDEISQNYRRTILKEGDIIFALRGEIGHVRFVSSTLAGCNLTRGVALISPSPIVYSRYLLWALRSPAVRREIILQVNGSALKEIPLSGLRKVLLPVPPTTEQKRLAALLDSTQFSEKINMDKVEFLQSVKRGLMQNLLSGSVRVTTP